MRNFLVFKSFCVVRVVVVNAQFSSFPRFSLRSCSRAVDLPSPPPRPGPTGVDRGSPPHDLPSPRHSTRPLTLAWRCGDKVRATLRRVQGHVLWLAPLTRCHIATTFDGTSRVGPRLRRRSTDESSSGSRWLTLACPPTTSHRPNIRLKPSRRAAAAMTQNGRTFFGFKGIDPGWPPSRDVPLPRDSSGPLASARFSGGKERANLLPVQGYLLWSAPTRLPIAERCGRALTPPQHGADKVRTHFLRAQGYCAWLVPPHAMPHRPYIRRNPSR